MAWFHLARSRRHIDGRPIVDPVRPRSDVSSEESSTLSSTDRPSRNVCGAWNTRATPARHT
jgi:hypothetical protein